MPFILILIASVLLAAAVRGTQGDLATALEQDVPGYAKWAAAIGGVGALGYIPGMRDISRMLLALVIVVLVLRNYRNILASFTSISTATPQPAAAPATPAATYVASVGGPAAGGTAGGNSSAVPAAAGGASLAGIDPTNFLSSFVAQTPFGAF